MNWIIITGGLLIYLVIACVAMSLIDNDQQDLYNWVWGSQKNMFTYLVGILTVLCFPIVFIFWLRIDKSEWYDKESEEK